jgi:tRNA(Ile)-lysidine synthase
MVMADLFIKAGMNVGIAHCNFSLRGIESDKDEELVKKLSARNKIPFYFVRFDTLNHAKETGISVQMAARELRYKWFEEIRKNNGFDFVAVAHNLNDNIETMLINLTRGTGIAGLTGMKPSVNHIIRPLLFATRNSIESYCRKNRIRYREDQSNTETKYTRNKIRHLVIPVLKEINPSVETTLNETAGRLGEVNDIMAEFINDLSEQSIIRDNNILKIRLKALNPFVGNNTVLYELFKPYGITGNSLDDLKTIIKGKTGSQVFTGTHRIIRNREEILITELSEICIRSRSAKNLKELKKEGGFKSVGLVDISTRFVIPGDRGLACVDYEKLRFPVIIRNWKPGDFFYPLGMNKKKKLSNYLIDRKYSRPEKEKLLILESNGSIVWLIGERIDNRFRITKRTRKALVIKV